MLSLALVVGASAQRVKGGGYHYVHPRVTYVYGAYSPFYPYYGYGFGFSPWGPYPYGYSPYAYNRPSKLSLEIEDIKNDYKDKISSAKHDKSLTKQERKDTVRELKKERDQAIDDKKTNYYKQK
jgi:hypothetical protein